VSAIEPAESGSTDPWVRLDDGVPALRGSRCGACDAVYYPARPGCQVCGGVIDGDVPIGREGVLELFSVSHVAPTGVQPPYLQGLVRLPEGPLVFARIECPHEEWAALVPGRPLRLRVGAVGEPERLGWWYRTVERADA